MAAIEVTTVRPAGAMSRAVPAGGVRFQWMMVALLGLLLGGLFLDGWAHTHNRVDRSFFTPWHAAFYSGYAGVALGLAGAVLLNYRRGYRGRHAIPQGYELSLLGAALFGGGGGFDLWWHSSFGIERSMEAATSPPHLLLALGMALMFTGPFRAAWRHPAPAAGLLAGLPVLLSLTYTWALLGFMTQYAHPFVSLRASTYGGGGDGKVIGVSSVLLQTALLMGLLLLTIRRWELPLGSLTIAFTLNAALIAVLEDRFALIPAALAAGIGADLLGRLLRPSPRRSFAFRLYAFAVPCTLYTCYFAVLARGIGIAWTLHMWLGAIVLAGGVGWLMSYLVLPPHIPDESEPRDRKSTHGA